DVEYVRLYVIEVPALEHSYVEDHVDLMCSVGDRRFRLARLDTRSTGSQWKAHHAADGHGRAGKQTSSEWNVTRIHANGRKSVVGSLLAQPLHVLRGGFGLQRRVIDHRGEPFRVRRRSAVTVQFNDGSARTQATRNLVGTPRGNVSARREFPDEPFQNLLLHGSKDSDLSVGSPSNRDRSADAFPRASSSRYQEARRYRNRRRRIPAEYAKCRRARAPRGSCPPEIGSCLWRPLSRRDPSWTE